MLPTEHATALTAAGFRIVPSNGKVPTMPGFGRKNPAFTCHPNCFDLPGVVVAVLCGPCPALGEDWLLCVDHDGPEGDPVVRAFLDTLPPTLSSHAGRHRFFAVRPGPLRDRLKQWNHILDGPTGAHIDLKWSGGYACEDGDWDVPLDQVGSEEIADLPDAALVQLLELGGSRQEEGPACAGTATSAEEAGYILEHVLEDAASWLQQSAPVAVEGQDGHGTLMVVFGGLIVGFGIDPETAIDMVWEHYNERCDPPWDESSSDFEHKAQQIEELGSERYRPLELAAIWRNIRTQKAAQASTPPPPPPDVPEDPDPGGVEFPRQDVSGCVLSRRTGWPYILQSGARYWIHHPGEPRYAWEATPADLLVTVNRYLFNQVNDDRRNLKDLQQFYIGHAIEVEQSYMRRDTIFDPKTGTVHVASLRWPREPAKRTFNPQIAAWLRALAGPSYPALEQWLVSCQVALDRPAPCLYFSGPPDVGKGLLASGVSALWGCYKPGMMRDAIGDFNPKAASCPVVWSDEGFPDGMSFERFREDVTSHVQWVNRKNREQSEVKGCARFLITANNDEVLRFQRTGVLSADDVKAISDRLLHIKCHDAAAARLALQQLDAEAVAGHLLAEHIRWMAHPEGGNVQLQPKGVRMCVAPTQQSILDGQQMMQNVLAAKYGDILDTVRDLLDKQETNGPILYVKHPAAPGGSLLVSVPSLYDRIYLVPSRTKVCVADIRAFCDSHALEKGAKKYRVGDATFKLRTLDLTKVEESIAACE